jgi:membrane-associated phospholipid phosphatase
MRLADPELESPRAAQPPARLPAWLHDAAMVDAAIYAAVAATPTPSLDAAMRRLTTAANHSRLSLAAAAVLAVTRGKRGREAAAAGLVAIGVTSAAVNLVAKPIARRRRPERDLVGVPLVRHVTMPVTRSFPSGHTAAAFAFATAVGDVAPYDAVGLRALAALVGYSRVHTGVHFPGDVVLGALIGTVTAQSTTRSLQRWTRRRRT